MGGPPGPGGSPPPSPEELATGVYHFTITEYTAVAGAVVYYYDMMLTWGDEFELLWERGSRLIKAIYLVNRYLPLWGVPSLLLIMNPIRTAPLPLALCTGMTLSNVVCQTIGTMCTTALFTLRIRSLYVGKKNIQRFLLGMLLAGHAVMIALTLFNLRVLITTMTAFQGGCIPGSNPAAGANYVSPIVIECVVIAFTIHHSITFKRTTQILDNSQTRAVLSRLYLDGGLYFLVAVGLRLWSACTFAFAPPTLGAVTLGPDYALTCTLTSRFFLSLRQSIQTSNWGSQYENSQIGNHGTYQNRSGQNSRTVAVTSGGGGGASRGKIGTTASKQSNGYGYNRRSGAFSKRGSLHGHGNGGMGRKPGSDLENQGHGQQLTNLTVISSMHMGSDWERDETPYYDGSDKLDRSDSSPGKPRRFEDDIELNSLGK